MADTEQFKDHFVLLCEAGFIAVNQADEDAASKLFKASELLNPENTLPKVGRGYMHLMKLELKDSCRLFEEVLAKEPDNEMAKTFLGLSYSLTTTEVEKGEGLLKQAAKKSDDPQVKKLADTTLDFVEKFVKKAPTPLESPPEEKKKEKNE
ncbi:MAG: hypothetical protein KR126chlam1_00826 [Chlamydiae bacterium]|nr:hypothetical protein [Chlamydiota bacterium]